MRELVACGPCGEGQLGQQIDHRKVMRVPERIVGFPVDVVSVAVGEKHTVLLGSDGKMYACGLNTEHQLGMGQIQGISPLQPVGFHHVGTKIVQIAAGRMHSLALADDGRLFAWGSNTRGQLAHPSSVPFKEYPSRIKSLTEVVQIASGADHCIAILENGRIFVWGEQQDGRILHEPKEITELLGVPIVRVVAGERHCIAISASGAIFSWGQNDHGQLGLGDIRPRPTPVLLPSVSQMKVVEAACGDSHTVLLTAEGRLFAFGSNATGQLGCGKAEKHLTPIAVSELMGSHVMRIAAGRDHTVAVVGGRAYTFGLNTYGQLGNGSDENQRQPRQIPDMDHVDAVFAGYDQTFFLRVGKLLNLFSGPNSPLQTPKFFESAKVKALLEKHEKLDLIGYIESVFQSMSCINGSFLYADERRFLTGDEKQSGLNMDQVMEAFNALAESPDAQQYGEIIMEMLQMSLFEVDFASVQWAECLRAFLILPWCHIFTTNVTSKLFISLHIPFAIRIISLNGYSRERLLRWYANLSEPRHFNRMVSSLLAGVRCMVRQKEVPQTFSQVLAVLDLLNAINQEKRIIPVENFYIHELMENYNLKLDYAELAATNTSRELWSRHPFLMNGIAKSELMYVDTILAQQSVLNSMAINILGHQFFMGMPVYEIHVRREHIVRDTMVCLRNAEPRDLSKPLKVSFVNEEADDGGGVRKEFFMLIFQKILQNDYGMFTENTESHLTWFSGLELGYNPTDDEEGGFHTLGALVGLAVYNRVLVNLPFPLALYKLILDQQPNLDDLCELSPTEGKGLQHILEYDEPDFEEVFLLTFTLSYDNFGSIEEVELKPNGANIPVTNANKQEYVELYVRHRLTEGLNGVIRRQIMEFCNGFKQLVTSRILNFFQPIELMEMIVGNQDYDWEIFKTTVKYKGDYFENHPTIKAFWEAFYKLTDDEKKQFLQFLSGSSRLPVAGITALECYIQPTAPETLPVAHTCFNLLDLPKIEDPTELLRRLRISIQHAEGFSLV